MLDFTNPKGLPLNGNQAAVPPHMAEALALVRAGRLQEATDLLMGNRSQGTAVSADAQPEPSQPEPSQPSERLSGLAARGMAGVQDVLNKLDLCGESSWVPPVGDAAVQAASQYRAGPNAQAPAPSAQRQRTRPVRVRGFHAPRRQSPLLSLHPQDRCTL